MMEQILRAVQRPCQSPLQGWQDLGLSIWLPVTRGKGAQATQLHWAGLFSVPLWDTQLCPGQAFVLHTFYLFSPCLTKNLSVLNRSKPASRFGSSVSLQIELCCERQVDFRPFQGSREENQKIQSSLFSLLNYTLKQRTQCSNILGVNKKLISRFYYLFHLPFQLSIYS